MSTNRTEEDWFLRGGERPKNDGEREELVPPPDDAVCQNCGNCWPGGTERCPVCGAALTGGTSTEEYCGADEPGLRVFVVTMTRTKSVAQEARVTVRATSEEEAMEKAEDSACEEQDEWTWTDYPATAEYEDCQAEDAEPLTS